MNKVILTGRLGQDPDSRTSNGGMAICRLSVATDEREKVNGEWQKATEWHRVVCFGRVAENVARYLSKGSRVGIEGRLKTNKWKDKEGVDRWTTEILASEVEFLDSKGDRQNGRTGSHDDYSGGNDSYDDDIPF